MPTEVKAAGLNWRACPECGIAPAGPVSNRCLLCHSETSELWNQHQCAGHGHIRVSAWQSYCKSSVQMRPESRPPRMLGYHPVTGLGAWEQAAVIAWFDRRTGVGHYARRPDQYRRGKKGGD